MLFEKVESKGLAQYSYIIGDGYEAIVIDPRRDCQIYIDLALNAGMQITHILETHRHEDFAIGSMALAQLTSALIWHADSQLPYLYGEAAEAGQVWHVGSLILEALHTPGHTEGSRSYVLFTPDSTPWMVFTGDALFTGEVGRVDFLGMDRAPEMAGKLFDSIFGTLLPRGDGAILCPGHGYGSACGSSIADRPWSTLGIERQLNPQLQFKERDAFVANVARKLPKPEYFSKMEIWNLQGPPSVKGLSGVHAYAPQIFSELMTDAVVLDLRSINAFAGGHVPGALSIAIVNLPSYIGWFVPPDATILLVCENEVLATAVAYLNRQGYDNIIGFLSGGMLGWAVNDLPIETTTLITPADLSSQLDQPCGLWLIDVRSEEECASGVLHGAHHIPVKEFNLHLEEIPVNNAVVMYCAEGPRAIAAVSALQRAGHQNVAMLYGGILGWSKNGLSIEQA